MLAWAVAATDEKASQAATREPAQPAFALSLCGVTSHVVSTHGGSLDGPQSAITPFITGTLKKGPPMIGSSKPCTLRIPRNPYMYSTYWITRDRGRLPSLMFVGQGTAFLKAKEEEEGVIKLPSGLLYKADP